jgi:uncharacterized protein (TIGR02646 family)
MLYVRKLDQAPADFTAIVGKYRDYKSLSESGADRDAIRLILLNEQGCLCAFCERPLEISTATIEHFQPKSSFPRLQLDYYNLFACCKVCNENKTDHLLPAYIFDSRLNALDPNHLILKRHRDFEMLYYVMEGANDCFLSVKGLEKRSKDKRQDDADWMLFLTMEVLGLNDPKRLREPRGHAYWELLKLMKLSSKAELIHLYQKYRATHPYPAPIEGQSYHRHVTFLSMKLYLVAEMLRKKGIDISTL